MCQNCHSDPELPLLVHQSTNRNCCTNRFESPTCYHYRRTSSSPCFELDTCNTLVQRCNTGESRIELLLRQLLTCCIEDTSTACCGASTSCCHTATRCTICDDEQHTLVIELTDLLERVSDGGLRCSCDTRRCRIPNRQCCFGSYQVIETQTLIDVFSRIVRRTHDHGRRSYSHGHRSTSRPRQVRLMDSGPRNLISQILDELECNGRAVCECQTCCEYIEYNSRRLRKEIKQIDVECRGPSSRDRGACGCAYGGGGCTQACCETHVTKTTVRAPAARKQRNGNIHVGWSL